jgi:tetratricopeptide (TPR) repeat protein
MCATHKSRVRRRLRRALGLTLALGIGFAPSLACARADGRPPRAAPARLAPVQRAFVEAQRRYLNEPTNHIAAWEFARATFERGEFSTNNAERATLAVQGIDACRQLIARDPRSAPGHYYLGMNLGQMARTKLLGALSIVDEMEREFKLAAALDELFDHAGPHRCLGLLYLEAPVLGSVGSRTKARKHLERAAELAPDFPENRLNLAEAYLQWRDKKLLRRELEALEELWPRARTNYVGPDWQADWADWLKRKLTLREKAAAVLRP